MYFKFSNIKTNSKYLGNIRESNGYSLNILSPKKVQLPGYDSKQFDYNFGLAK